MVLDKRFPPTTLAAVGVADDEAAIVEVLALALQRCRSRKAAREGEEQKSPGGGRGREAGEAS